MAFILRPKYVGVPNFNEVARQLRSVGWALEWIYMKGPQTVRQVRSENDSKFFNTVKGRFISTPSRCYEHFNEFNIPFAKIWICPKKKNIILYVCNNKYILFRFSNNWIYITFKINNAYNNLDIHTYINVYDFMSNCLKNGFCCCRKISSLLNWA